MEISNYEYFLPKELIAQSPPEKREDSRLFVAKGTRCEHKKFKNIVDYLRKDDVLVINESKVIPAKLVGKKETGSRIWVILTRKLKDCYEAVVKGRVKVNSLLLFENNVSAKVIEKHESIAKLRFSKKLTLANLQKIGQMPIPPYVKRQLKNQSRYQTVYARKQGSIAAHTAGLHFTQELINKIKKKGVKIAKICLHISYSTFFPIRGPIRDHKMHPEFCEINKKNADIINNRKGRLFAVGTTVVKTIESFADKNGTIKPGCKQSDLFIYPPYQFKVNLNGMITNFHLPKSTLLLLVSAYWGRESILKLYEEAIRHRYRFYSFGDAMLLLKE